MDSYDEGWLKGSADSIVDDVAEGWLDDFDDALDFLDGSLLDCTLWRADTMGSLDT